MAIRPTSRWSTRTTQWFTPGKSCIWVMPSAGTTRLQARTMLLRIARWARKPSPPRIHIAATNTIPIVMWSGIRGNACPVQKRMPIAIWISPVIPTRAARILATIFMRKPSLLSSHDVKQPLKLLLGDLAAGEAPFQNRLGVQRSIPSPAAAPPTPEERKTKEQEQEEHREQDTRKREPPVRREHGMTSFALHCPWPGRARATAIRLHDILLIL